MAEQLFQIGIKGLIRDEGGRILMVHIPEWGQNPEHWDLPGGRMDPGEAFLQTLRRELVEEIGVAYEGDPRQIMSVLTNITIPVGEMRVPLALVIYEATLPRGSAIKLDPQGAEDDYQWFSPLEAAERLSIKFTPDFCEWVRSLPLPQP